MKFHCSDDISIELELYFEIEHQTMFMNNVFTRKEMSINFDPYAKFLDVGRKLYLSR
jgi:hypothetical protein